MGTINLPAHPSPQTPVAGGMGEVFVWKLVGLKRRPLDCVREVSLYGLKNWYEKIKAHFHGPPAGLDLRADTQSLSLGWH